MHDERENSTQAPAHAVGTVAPVRPIALARQAAAQFCGLDVATWDAFRAAGRLPTPVVEDRDASGRPRRVLWLVRDLEAWVEAGMPTQAEVAEDRRARESMQPRRSRRTA